MPWVQGSHGVELVATGILSGIDRIPDRWLDKIPYFQSPEIRQAKKDKRRGRQPATKSTTDNDGEKKRNDQKGPKRGKSVDHRYAKEPRSHLYRGEDKYKDSEDDEDEEDGDQSDYNGLPIRPRYERRRTKSVDEYSRRQDQVDFYTDRRPSQASYGADMRNGRPYPSLDTTNRTTNGYTNGSPYGNSSATAGLATGYVPYSDVYSSPVSSLPPTRRASATPAVNGRDYSLSSAGGPGSQSQSRRGSINTTSRDGRAPGVVFASQYTQEPRFHNDDGYNSDVPPPNNASLSNEPAGRREYFEGSASRRGSVSQTQGRYQ